MPTYEYECSNARCAHRWELFQSIKAEAERGCPKCRRATAVRRIGIGAGILSGGRGGKDAEPAPAAQEAAAAGPAKPAGNGAATDASAAAPKAADPAGAPKAAPAATPTAPPASSAAEGRVNATHPAREGRGAGNLRDAIRRQRAEPGGKAPGRAPAKPARGAARRGRGPSRG